MDLTPEVLRDVEFRERLRGYDQDEVDEFLERVGIAVGQLQERLRDVQARVDHAEARAAQVESGARDRGDADETLRRVLVLAQRTADAAIAEAREEAEQILVAARDDAARTRSEADAHATRTRSEADAHATRVRGEADDVAARMVAEAERTVRDDVGAMRGRLEAEIGALETARDRLSGDVGQLETHLDEQRTRLLADLDALRSIVEESSWLRVAPAPEVPAVDRPDTTALDELLVEVQDPDDEVAPVDVVTEPETDAAPMVTPPEADEADDLSTLPPPPAVWGADPAVEPPRAPSLFADPVESSRSAPAAAPRGWEDGPAAPAGWDADHDGEPAPVAPSAPADGEPAPVAPSAPVDDDPPTEATPVVGMGTSTGGSHLDELRRAVADDGPDEETDAAMAAFFDQEKDGPARRFGRKR